MSELSFKDFASDQEVRWCPGCGDYAILRAVHKSLAEVGARPENTVFVSGIGCAARLPYYVNAYGFHTIHGRAPAVATGVKLANPDLDVWVITGDGDGLSIGGNHLIHALRRNVDLNILLFNNEIYGLTKGQYSPTSRCGTKSPSSPGGSVDQPVVPCQLALGAGASFIARAVDIDQKGLPGLFAEARAHTGSAFVEILQNCIVYNKDIFDDVSSRKTAPDNTVLCIHGEPLIFGAERDRGLRFNPQTYGIEVVALGEGGVSEDDLIVHDRHNRNLAQMLVALHRPLALGVIFQEQRPSFESAYWNARPRERRSRVEDLLRRGQVLGGKR